MKIAGGLINRVGAWLDSAGRCFMDKAKSAVPPPQNRGPNGRFLKGNRANPGGRTQKLPEVKEFCKSQSMRGVEKLRALMDDAETQVKDVIAIVRLFLEYGYGRPAAEFDRERLELEKRRVDADINRQDAGPRVIEVVFGEGAEDFTE
jgi:hypothetical protein